jgi:phage shock protein A
MIARLVVAGLVLAASGRVPAADSLPRFTEEREAAALHFVRKHCPELSPLLEELKKSSRPAYEQQIRETFQVTELLADLQDDTKRYELELKIWKAENKAMVLVARLATPKEDDRKAIEEQLHVLAKELVDLEIQSLEHRVEVLTQELTGAREELTKAKESVDRTTKERFESFLEKARKKRGG